MKSPIDPQDLARRFNEGEAVWRRYRQKRELRRLFGPQVPFPEEVLDDLDWLQAEEECRKTRCIGKPIP